MIQVFRLFLVLIAFVGGFAVRTWWPAQQFSLPPLLISILPVILFLAFAVFGQLFLLFRGKEEDTGFYRLSAFGCFCLAGDGRLFIT